MNAISSMQAQRKGICASKLCHMHPCSRLGGSCENAPVMVWARKIWQRGTETELGTRTEVRAKSPASKTCTTQSGQAVIRFSKYINSFLMKLRFPQCFQLQPMNATAKIILSLLHKAKRALGDTYSQT